MDNGPEYERGYQDGVRDGLARGLLPHCLPSATPPLGTKLGPHMATGGPSDFAYVRPGDITYTGMPNPQQ